MARRFTPLAFSRNSGRGFAVLAILALCLRLALPTPQHALGATAADLAAVFGEHALCVAAAGSAEAPAPPPATPTEHDHNFGCCLWHAAFGGAPASVVKIERVAFGETVDISPPQSLYRAAKHLPGASQPRAPPLRARV